MLGSDVDVISEAPTEADIAGTTLHRIVRGINMGEAVILVIKTQTTHRAFF